MKHIPLITRLAEVVIVAHCTPVPLSLEVPFGATVTNALMRGGAFCWWSRRQRSRCGTNRCAAQAVDEQTQERLAVTFRVPWTFITCNRNIAELVLGGPSDDRTIIVPEEDLVDDFVGA
jgi:hypothetical protein